MVSSRKAPRSFSFSYITAALKLEKLKSLNPSLMNENNHYKHMLTQKETDRRVLSLSGTGLWYFKKGKQVSLLFCSKIHKLICISLNISTEYLGQCWFFGKDPDAGRDWGQEEKGTTEDEMAGWHHRLNGHEFEQTPGVGDGQGGLVCCDSWGREELDTAERVNWTELIFRKFKEHPPQKCVLMG